ncbi:MAG: type II secretion system protein [Synergistaceae bacterium]|nr:type II secretion system protein [Synergistaceae bacterium]
MRFRSGFSGFTLTEVLVATAVAGLVISAGFRLMAMSYRLLAELDSERELYSAAQEVWFRFRTEQDMPSSGKDDKKNFSWQTDNLSFMVDDFELKYRKVTVSTANGRSTIIYVPE